MSGTDMAKGADFGDGVVLQTITFPDPAICSQDALFFRLSGAARRMSQPDRIVLADGDGLHLDAWVNLFNLGNWLRHTRLDRLHLTLRGSGRMRVVVWLVSDAGRRVLRDAEHVLDAGLTLDLTDSIAACRAGGGDGLLVLDLTARGDAVMLGGHWLSPQGAPASLRLAISITTFRREAEVALTVARLCAHLDRHAGRGDGHDGIHIHVVDNGQSVSLPPDPRLTVLPNPNHGGAGGFARGLLAAQAAGFTHCLFMDDDASFQMENLVRTLAFLRLARSPAAAVSGAMISTARPWAMWENGAVFDRSCKPQFVATDLRDPAEVAEMEIEAARPKPAGFYGGWWYFAFPIAQVRFYPFPFFVRGDDISFSLANRFDTVTLNGVMSFQEDFSVKQSPQTLYLDLRNHLAHHLSQPHMQIGAMASARIALRFFTISLVRMHYDSAAAQLLAWRDVMEGPEFFVRNIDMADRRATIAAMVQREVWREGGDPTRPAPENPDRPVPGRLFTLAMKYSLNGHLLPFWRLLGRRVTIESPQRGLVWLLWGAKEAHFASPDGTRSYSVRHDKRRAAALMVQALRQTLRWRRDYPALLRAWQEAYPRIAARSFWEAQYGAPALPPRKAEAQAAE